MTTARDDWANYRRFVHHKNALDMIFNHALSPQRRKPDTREDTAECVAVSDHRGMTESGIAGGFNRDAQYDVERAADEEGVSVTDYLRGPSCSGS